LSRLPAQFRIYLDVLKAAIGRFVDADMPTQSAALAYYMVFSLPPMLLIVLWTGELLYKEVEIRDAVFAEIAVLVGEEGARQLMGTIEGLNIEHPTLLATLVGIAVLLFTASTALVTIQNALKRLFEVPPADTVGKGIWQFFHHRLVSFAMLIVISFILSVSLVIDAAITAFDLYLAAWLGQFSHTLVVIDSILVELLAMTLLFALMFRYLTDVRLKWRDIWIGALLTAALFSFGQYLIGYLIGRNEIANLYDAAGSILVLMLWVFYASAILFFGASFTFSLARVLGNQAAAVKTGN
jgi:membrane protein